MTKQTDAVARAVSILGGKTRTAVYLGVVEGSVKKMMTGERKVSPVKARWLEHFTDGTVTAAELCPEVFGDLNVDENEPWGRV